MTEKKNGAKSSKLKAKDFISIGIFTAIYFVGSMIFSIGMGITPQTYFFGSIPLAIVLGPVFMLYLAKVGKKFSILIMGIVMTTVVGLMTNSFITLSIVGYGGTILAEIIASSGEYKSFKKNSIAYGLFTMWPVGVYLGFWVFTDKLMEATAQGYGDGYAQILSGLLSPVILVIIIVGTFLAGLIGAVLGKAMLKKHFERAGIV